MKGTVIFDMDGVLLDSEQLDYRCWHEAAEKMGLHDPDKAFFRSIGRPRGDILDVLAAEYSDVPDFSPEGFLKESLAIFDRFLEEHGTPIKPYAAECLSGLKKAGFTVGIASSTQVDRVKQQMTDGGLISYFDDIVGGGMFKRGKPDPEIFLLSCERLGGVPAETIVIEDSYNGIRAAYAAGMKPVMVPDMVQPDDEIRAMCHRVCRDLGEVLERCLNGTV